MTQQQIEQAVTLNNSLIHNFRTVSINMSEIQEKLMRHGQILVMLEGPQKDQLLAESTADISSQISSLKNNITDKLLEIEQHIAQINSLTAQGDESEV
jgi:hypothetical protein